MTTPPDPTNPDLMEGLRNYLVTQGIVRIPEVAGSLPPLWITPRLGTPAPGQGDDMSPQQVGDPLVASISKTTGIPSRRYEGFLRNDGVGFVVRSRKAFQAYEFENAVRSVINDKRGWQMDTVPVNESLLFKDLQLVDSNNFAYTYTFEYMFSLWGPFQPVGP